MRGLAIALALLVGCHVSQESQVEDVAEQLCHCIAADTDATCVPSLKQVLGTTVDDACVQCVFDTQNTCAAMIDTCAPLCIQNLPPTGKTMP